MLVTGATGAVGRRLTAWLGDHGARVRVLVRQPADVLGAASVRHGDITSPDDVAAAVAGMDAVVHLAALLHVTNPPPALDAEYRRINDDATAGLVRACERAGVQRLVYASTIAVYGPRVAGLAPVDEKSPCRPATSYARTKLAGEAHVLAARSAAGRPLGVVLRLGAVYGPGIKGNYRRLFDALARGRYVQVGDGRNRRSLVHEVDVARAVGLALTHPDAPGGTFNVTDGSTPTVADIVAAMCGALGRRPPRLRVPVSLARVAAGAVEVASHAVRRRPPVTRAAIDTLVEDVAVDGHLLQRRLGFVPSMSLAEGWRDAANG